MKFENLSANLSKAPKHCFNFLLYFLISPCVLAKHFLQLRPQGANSFNIASYFIFLHLFFLQIAKYLEIWLLILQLNLDQPHSYKQKFDEVLKDFAV